MWIGQTATELVTCGCIALSFVRHTWLLSPKYTPHGTFWANHVSKNCLADGWNKLLVHGYVDTRLLTARQQTVVAMATLARLASTQVVCATMIVVVILCFVAQLLWMIQTSQPVQSSFADELIRQRNDISRRLNSLQVNFSQRSTIRYGMIRYESIQNI